MSDPLLEIDDLHVYYGKAHALKGVSVSVERGEIYGVIGPNGAGKTTMLNAVAGFVDYEGTIRYDGRDLADERAQDIVQDGLIYCTEDRDLFPFFSVHENLLMGAQFRDDREAVEADLEMVYDLFPRLDERREQEAETMSGGEQQMLAIGRALMSDPEMLMLDEPTIGLAPVIIQDISEAIERLLDEGLTILLAEQNSTFALRHAERLSLIETGEIELEGTASEFHDNEYVREAYVGVH
ncbi:ABC transporter ATP-binding protein [Natronorubrum daqingense]|uniref:ABC transporter ATP-binding protein n=1 Tax=Natronorubrum daqingense TaxID=588898 RepID=A0A1N6YT95_9EURY|nr:ABC transporter ATP-binding protein [Natronorubrum daqingense]APX95570.1 ABC transporter ATP-binding protein [Natronorubrum daqingense]SIR17786.1 amino acid/amide ABC transporter ATP-binding protein 2, HAAT family [Natronorubrum daqingense]